MQQRRKERMVVGRLKQRHIVVMQRLQARKARRGREVQSRVHQQVREQKEAEQVRPYVDCLCAVRKEMEEIEDKDGMKLK